MSDAIALQKSILRRAIRAQLAGISTATRDTSGDSLSAQLRDLPILNGRGHLLAFHPHRNEVSALVFLREWLAGGRLLSFPRVESDKTTLCAHQVSDISELKPGYREILEPDPSCGRTELESVEAVFVPGLAFDVRGNRLGQGGGHYDRLLAALPRTCATIGLAYDWQVIDSVPVAEHDHHLQWIVTPARIIDCNA